MKRQIQAFVLIITFLTCVVIIPQVFGGERIGNLIFKSMKELEDRQEQFTAEVQSLRVEREKAVQEKEEIKKKFLKAKDGSLDQKEAHAEYTYTLAKIYRASFGELKLIRSVSKDHLTTLGRLERELKNGDGRFDQKMATKVINNGKSFISTSNSFLKSLADNKELIKDKQIKLKLANAYSVAKMLEIYITRLERNQTSVGFSRHILMQKINELIQALEVLYLNSGVLLGITKERTLFLRLINEVATAEMSTLKLTGGQKMVSSIQDQVLEPLKNTVNETDVDLDILVQGLDSSPDMDAAIDESWTEGFKLDFSLRSK